MKRIGDFRFAISEWNRALCAAACAVIVCAGCIGKHPANPAATRPVTVKDLASTQPAYWLDQAAATTVENFQFQPLWDACERVARSYQFALDRQDYRLGLITTRPTISKQLLEPWRKDAGTADDVVQDSLTTIRRTLRFEIERTDDGTFLMTPKVLVERQTIVERRITSSAQYRIAFAGPIAPARETQEAEPVETLTTYWTPIGRDRVMERQVADAVRRNLKHQAPQ